MLRAISRTTSNIRRRSAMSIIGIWKVTIVVPLKPPYAKLLINVGDEVRIGAGGVVEVYDSAGVFRFGFNVSFLGGNRAISGAGLSNRYITADINVDINTIDGFAFTLTGAEDSGGQWGGNRKD
jgi:hypothetical protein